MNSFVKKGLYCALFVGGLSLLGVGAANAATTDGTDATASGTQVAPDLTAPVTLDGNAISLLGDSSSSGSPTDTAPSGPLDGTSSAAATDGTDGTDGVATGSQVAPDVVAPVTVENNAVSLLSDSSSTGTQSTGEQSTGTQSTGESTAGATGTAEITTTQGTAEPNGVTGTAVLSGAGATTGYSSTGDALDPIDVTASLPDRVALAVESAGSGRGYDRAGLDSFAPIERLAATGANPLPLLVVLALFPLVGFGLMFGARHGATRA